MTKRIKNLTGPVETGPIGYGATDLAIMQQTVDGRICLIHGDTFSGNKVNEGKWMSPVADYWALDGISKPLRNVGVVGAGDGKVDQLVPYVHKNAEFDTVLPSSVVKLPDGRWVLHTMYVKALGDLQWTEFWVSDDEGQTWTTEAAKFPKDAFGGHLFMVAMAINPADGYVYIYGTGWRDRGVIMLRVLPEDLFDISKWSGWGYNGTNWDWDRTPTEVMKGRGYRFGEMDLKFIDGCTVLTYFDVDNYAIKARVLKKPTDNWYTAKVVTPVSGTDWIFDNGTSATRMAQLYGAYVVPTSKLGVTEGFGLVISQWKTSTGTPYRICQFSTTVPLG